MDNQIDIEKNPLVMSLRNHNQSLLEGFNNERYEKTAIDQAYVESIKSNIFLRKSFIILEKNIEKLTIENSSLLKQIDELKALQSLHEPVSSKAEIKGIKHA